MNGFGAARQTMKQDARWAASMNGVHLVMGWQTNMADADNFGKKFANRMVDSGWFDSAYLVKESWFYAAEKTHGHVDRTAEVIGENKRNGVRLPLGPGKLNSDPTDDSTFDTLVVRHPQPQRIARPSGPGRRPERDPVPRGSPGHRVWSRKSEVANNNRTTTHHDLDAFDAQRRCPEQWRTGRTILQSLGMLCQADGRQWRRAAR